MAGVGVRAGAWQGSTAGRFSSASATHRSRRSPQLPFAAYSPPQEVHPRSQVREDSRCADTEDHLPHEHLTMCAHGEHPQ